MINDLLHKIKVILKDMWEDFKNPTAYHPVNNSCCCYTPSYQEKKLQSEPIRINNKVNNLVRNTTS